MLDISPLTRALGAEIKGVDLRQPLADALYTAIRNALVCKADSLAQVSECPLIAESVEKVL